MAIDTAVFLAGVAILVSLDFIGLGIGIQTMRDVGKDETAREWAKEAEEQAQTCHTRLSGHLIEEHDYDIEPHNYPTDPDDVADD